MTSNQRFDEHIKEQFDNYAPDVHPRIWENIVAQKDKRRPAGFWLSLLNSRNILVILSLLLAGAAQGQSRRTRGGVTPLPCTTRTGLHCEIYGHGQPILFLHGLGGNSYSWRFMVEPLSQ